MPGEAALKEYSKLFYKWTGWQFYFRTNVKQTKDWFSFILNILQVDVPTVILASQNSMQVCNQAAYASNARRQR